MAILTTVLCHRPITCGYKNKLPLDTIPIKELNCINSYKCYDSIKTLNWTIKTNNVRVYWAYLWVSLSKWIAEINRSGSYKCIDWSSLRLIKTVDLIHTLRTWKHKKCNIKKYRRRNRGDVHLKSYFHSLRVACARLCGSEPAQAHWFIAILWMLLKMFELHSLFIANAPFPCPFDRASILIWY